MTATCPESSSDRSFPHYMLIESSHASLGV
jgi:hypothetical protein